MHVTFHGAVREVTGSAHLVSAGEDRILLDCGLFQGRRAEAWEQNSQFPFDPASIDALVLSHAHIDHSGKIPMLYRHGFRGPIYCTAATRDLANIMLGLHKGEIEPYRSRLKQWSPDERASAPDGETVVAA